jgi:hypothetical protein
VVKVRARKADSGEAAAVRMMRTRRTAKAEDRSQDQLDDRLQALGTGVSNKGCYGSGLCQTVQAYRFGLLRGVGESCLWPRRGRLLRK